MCLHSYLPQNTFYFSSNYSLTIWFFGSRRTIHTPNATHHVTLCRWLWPLHECLQHGMYRLPGATNPGENSEEGRYSVIPGLIQELSHPWSYHIPPVRRRKVQATLGGGGSWASPLKEEYRRICVPIFLS